MLRVIVWGSGTPRREFLYVDDLADAGLHLLRHYSGAAHINIGAGYDVTIAEFAEHIKIATGRNAAQTTRQPHSTGWKAQTDLERGLRLYYDWFLSNQGKLRETIIEPAKSD